ncbi:1-acylglycerol-3-phosphate O-acyltransferase [Coemansia nantahalensis]|uniref:1-acylglycerol-3-phosphate O-acyltransferase n=2 Tax=Coemansia TaxID=4863 RepID=A0ACC1L1C4_9FUNG|nr:1-acylglycerol-3-phosphate O-acyltransferase [Coemansia nantahalensis]KAJ2799004.1 1-acylglycerol-3-phosphate O-acyltransferase [Coemansia helicoidea]
MHWLLWAALLEALLAGAALLSRRARFFRSMLHFTLCAAVGSVVGIVAAPVLWACGRRASTNWLVARTFYYAARAVLGISVEVEGAEHLRGAQPCVLASNHQTMLDLLVLGRVFPMQTVILAKKAISYYPLVGWFMRLAGDIFISRGSRQSASDMFRAASAELRAKNVSVWFFPEGTRGRFDDGPGLLPFKQGAFLLAYHARVPVVPVVVMDFHNIYNRRRFWCAPGSVRVKILEPVSLDGIAEDNLRPLIDSTRERMLAELRLISPARAAN